MQGKNSHDMLFGGNFYGYGVIATLSLLLLFYLLRKNPFKQRIYSFHISAKILNYDDIKNLFRVFERVQCKITNKKIEKMDNHLKVSVNYVSTPAQNHNILSSMYKLKSVDSFKQH